MRAGGPRFLWRPPWTVAFPGYPPGDRGRFRDSLHAAPLRTPEGRAQHGIEDLAREGHGAVGLIAANPFALEVVGGNDGMGAPPFGVTEPVKAG